MTLNETREILNGIWAVASLCVFILLIAFILTRRVGYNDWDWRWRKPGWYQDRGVQVAGALAILVLGHFMRSAPQWIQFIIINHQGPNIDITTLEVYRIATWLFVPATILVVTGKILSIWAISPGEWNWVFALSVLVLTFTIPLLVFWLH